MIKKALLVGINEYRGCPLNGCLNDVEQIDGLLKGSYGFDPGHIRILTDKAATYRAMVEGLEWLTAPEPGGDQSDVRVFHYSGHGSYQADKNGDESDGRDEALCPYDYHNGLLIDDDLNKLYAKVPKGSNLTLLMDCCHSGTNQKGQGRTTYRFLRVSDEEEARIEQAREKYLADRKAFVKSEIRALRKLHDPSDEEIDTRIDKALKAFDRKRGNFGNVTNRQGNLLLAGCKAAQTSADAEIEGKFHGAFTYFLGEAIKALGPQASYKSLIAHMGPNLRGYDQTPQLEGAKAHKELPLFASFPTP